MKHYAMIRCERLKTWSDFVEASRHNVRDQRNSSTIEGCPPPLELIPRGPISLPEHARRTLKSLGLKPDPEKVTAVEYVVSASPEWFEGKDAEKLAEWIKSSLKFLRKKHGPGLISATLHLDESTPHIHVICLPVYHDIVRKRGAKPKTPEAKAKRDTEELDAPKVWRISYDRVMGSGRLALRNLQTDYHLAVRHLGLARGEDTVGQGKRHTPLAEYRKELDARQTMLDNQEAELWQRNERLERAKAEIDFQYGEISRLERLVEVQQSQIQLRRDQILREAATAEQRKVELDARETKLAETEKNITNRGDALVQQENNLSLRQNAHAVEISDYELKLNLLRRHADHSQPLVADSGILARTFDERRAAEGVWSEPMRFLKELILSTRRSRQRLVLQLQRLRNRLKDARRRETENAAQATALEKRSAVMLRQENENSRLSALAKQHENSTRETLMKTNTFHHQIAFDRSDLATRQEAVKSQQVSQQAKAAELHLLEKTLAKQQTDLDADQEKVVKERAALATAVSELKREQALLAEAQKQHQLEVSHLGDRRSDLETESVRISSAKVQAQAEGKFLQGVISGQIAVKIDGGKPLVHWPNGWTEVIINHRRLSERTTDIVSMVVSAQSERAQVLQIRKQLEETASEIEILRPESKAQLDNHRSAMSAAIAHLNRSGGR